MRASTATHVPPHDPPLDSVCNHLYTTCVPGVVLSANKCRREQAKQRRTVGCGFVAQLVRPRVDMTERVALFNCRFRNARDHVRMKQCRSVPFSDWKRLLLNGAKVGELTRRSRRQYRRRGARTFIHPSASIWRRALPAAMPGFNVAETWITVTYHPGAGPRYGKPLTSTDVLRVVSRTPT